MYFVRCQTDADQCSIFQRIKTDKVIFAYLLIIFVFQGKDLSASTAAVHMAIADWGFSAEKELSCFKNVARQLVWVILLGHISFN